MRVWDVAAGYLNRQSLLAEHRELHGIRAIVIGRKKGYAQHPETLRWIGALSGLAWRHAHLAAEMHLRGYTDRTPLRLQYGHARWPSTFVTDPAAQITLLRQKYAGKEHGRIPLPRNAQQLWAQHKYSVMARDLDAYRHFGRAVAAMRKRDSFDDLARALVLVLREPPPRARLVNALEHMWGHVSAAAGDSDKRALQQGPATLLSKIQALALAQRETFLLASTALSELAAYVE